MEKYISLHKNKYAFVRMSFPENIYFDNLKTSSLTEANLETIFIGQAFLMMIRLVLNI